MTLFAKEVADSYCDAAQKKYGESVNPKIGYDIPTKQQRRLISTNEVAVPDELLFHQAVHEQSLASMSGPIKFHGAPDDSESHQANSQEFVTVGSSGDDTLNIRLIENNLLFRDEDLEDEVVVGTSPEAFIRRTEEEMWGNLIYDDNNIGFRGVAQDANFTVGNSLNSNIGWIKLLKDWANAEGAANVISEGRAGSGVLTFGDVRKVPCDAGAVVDAGGGLVTIPCSRHGFPVGAEFRLSGTSNYKGKYVVDPTSDADNLTFAAKHAAENVNSADHLAILIPDKKSLPSVVQFALSLHAVVAEKKMLKMAVLANSTLFGQSSESDVSKQSDDIRKLLVLEAGRRTIAGKRLFRLGSMPAGSILLGNLKRMTRGKHQKLFTRTIKHDDDKRGLAWRNKRYRGFGLQDPGAMILLENLVRIESYEK